MYRQTYKKGETMEFLELLKVIILGIVEGITEWLPVSSTGHILLLEHVWPLEQSDAFKNVFVYFVQAGAILSVVVLYFKKLCPFKIGVKEPPIEVNTDGERIPAPTKRLYSDKQTWVLWAKIAVACIPALVGIFVDMPDEPAIIAAMLIFYGVAFILVETLFKRKSKVESVHQITWAQALIIGVAQALSIIPGTSRSGVTILAALLLGISRPAGAEFTFFLGIPVILGASFLKIVKYGLGFSGYEYIYLLTGFLVAFAASMLCIKLLMRFVQKHRFTVFGWYRIALGALVLGVLVIPKLFS